MSFVIDNKKRGSVGEKLKEKIYEMYQEELNKIIKI